MSDQKDKVAPPERPEKADHRPGVVEEQDRDNNIQHGRNAQRPDVNPGVQPGHRDREEV